MSIQIKTEHKIVQSENVCNYSTNSSLQFDILTTFSGFQRGRALTKYYEIFRASHLGLMRMQRSILQTACLAHLENFYLDMIIENTK